jgi:hypothetical protein
MRKPVSEVLQTAKSVLMEKGVAKNHFYDCETNSYCSMGAIEVATGVRVGTMVDYGKGEEGNSFTRAMAYELLNKVMDDENGIPGFNDSRSPGEVLAAFDEAIQVAKQWEADRG